MSSYKWELTKRFIRTVEEAQDLRDKVITKSPELSLAIREFKKWVTFYKNNFTNEELENSEKVMVGEEEVDSVTATMIGRENILLEVMYSVQKDDHKRRLEIIGADVKLFFAHKNGEVSDEEYQTELKKAKRLQRKYNL